MPGDPWDLEPTDSDQLCPGRSNPGELVAPIVRYRNGKTTGRDSFFGTATLLGNGFFLTARHVLEEPLAARPLASDEWLGLIALTRMQRDQTYIDTISRVTDWEFHPDERIDLAVGLVNSSRPRSFSTMEHGSLGLDVECLGFPKDLHMIGVSEEESWTEARFLKGHITRPLEAGTFAASAPSLELSFAPTEGMSGSPVYHRHHEAMLGLLGIALRSGAEHVPAAYLDALFDEPAGRDQDSANRRIYKVVEYGVALRLKPIRRWRIHIAGGRDLETLVTGHHEPAEA